MPRYIDADALKELIDGGFDIDFDEVPETKKALLNMIDHQEAADVVEKERYVRVRENADILSDALSEYQSDDFVKVVRCKDCKYWHREIHNGIEYFNFSSCELNHYGDGHNFYCSDGERKTGDGEIH